GTRPFWTGGPVRSSGAATARFRAPTPRDDTRVPRTECLVAGRRHARNASRQAHAGSRATATDRRVIRFSPGGRPAETDGRRRGLPPDDPCRRRMTVGAVRGAP